MQTKLHSTDFQPRILTRQQAAQYCGLTPEGFDNWRKRGLVPGPIPGTRRWDRHALDKAIDKIAPECLNSSSFHENKDDAFMIWKESRGL